MTETTTANPRSVTPAELRRRLKPFKLPKTELNNLSRLLDTHEKLDRMCEALHKWNVQRLAKRIETHRISRYNDLPPELIYFAQGVVGTRVIHNWLQGVQPAIDSYPDGLCDALASLIATSGRRDMRLKIDHNGTVELFCKEQGNDRDMRLATLPATNDVNQRLFWRTFSRILVEKQLNREETDPRFPVECSVATLLLLSGRNPE